MVLMLCFGPVPSRRLGKSIGINHIPPEIYSYSCIYCQLGRTTTLHIDRASFYTPEVLMNELQKKIMQAEEHQESSHKGGGNLCTLKKGRSRMGFY